MPSGSKPCPRNNQYSKQEKETCEKGKDLVKVVWFVEAVERLHRPTHQALRRSCRPHRINRWASHHLGLQRRLNRHSVSDAFLNAVNSCRALMITAFRLAVLRSGQFYLDKGDAVAPERL